jgi:hypothetical protein
MASSVPQRAPFSRYFQHYFPRYGRFIAAVMLLVYALLTLSSGMAYTRVARNDAAGQWVCTAVGGMKWVADDDAGSSGSSLLGDCPLCMHQVSALPLPSDGWALPISWVDAQPSWLRANVALPRFSTGPPMPACGPPILI